jgi:hypothetical protein
MDTASDRDAADPSTGTFTAELLRLAREAGGGRKKTCGMDVYTTIARLP